MNQLECTSHLFAETLSVLKLSSPAVVDMISTLGMLFIGMILTLIAVMLGITAQSGCRSDGVYCYLHIPQVHLPLM